MASFVPPMKAVSIPPDQLPSGEGWVFELKWDGMRAIVVVDKTAADQPVRIFSANHIDATPRFPELAGIADTVHVEQAVIDGEIVMFDARGTPDFGMLQSRMHLADRREAARRAQTDPVVFIAFDLLAVDGHDITQLPLSQRRGALDAIFANGAHWQLSPVHDDGAALLDAARTRHLEGVMAKSLTSPYTPGRRSHAWRKCKLRIHDEFVVGGWRDGEGGRRGSIGSLLIGWYDPDGVLRYAGRVGSGLDDAEIRALTARFADLEQQSSPFKTGDGQAPDAAGAHWVTPELVVEVAYAELTREGRVRHSSYLARRSDKDPRAVTRPGP